MVSLLPIVAIFAAASNNVDLGRTSIDSADRRLLNHRPAVFCVVRRRPTFRPDFTVLTSDSGERQDGLWNLFPGTRQGMLITVYERGPREDGREISKTGSLHSVSFHVLPCSRECELGRRNS